MTISSRASKHTDVKNSSGEQEIPELQASVTGGVMLICLRLCLSVSAPDPL